MFVLYVLLVFFGTGPLSNQPQFAKEPTIHRGVDGQRRHFAVEIGLAEVFAHNPVSPNGFFPASERRFVFDTEQNQRAVIFNPRKHLRVAPVPTDKCRHGVTRLDGDL